MVPNIFKYATKELSQDALICWLVACAREADGNLRECGREFVQALMRSRDGYVFNVTNEKHESYTGEGIVTDVKEPCPQHGGIDVYFQATVDGNVVSFVVEDKTHTEPHSNQLQRYRRLVEGDSIKEDLVKAVYFKTGYVFDDEREQVEGAGYSVFDAEDIVGFFRDGHWSGTHPFVSDFAEHAGTLVDGRHQALTNWNLNWAFVQWKFMVALGKKIDASKFSWPARGVNTGGGAWTQYPDYEPHGRLLFWRLDSDKPLRLMVDTQMVGDEEELKWDSWDQTFQETAKQCGLEEGPFRRVRNRNGSPVAEGTIGAVDVGSCLLNEGIDECVKRVCELNRRFAETSGLTRV